jgi:hypothetical protein
MYRGYRGEGKVAEGDDRRADRREPNQSKDQPLQIIRVGCCVRAIPRGKKNSRKTGEVRDRED